MWYDRQKEFSHNLQGKDAIDDYCDKVENYLLNEFNKANTKKNFAKMKVLVCSFYT